MSSKVPRDKAADLILLETDLQQQHPQLPGLVRREDRCLGGRGGTDCTVVNTVNLNVSQHEHQHPM